MIIHVARRYLNGSFLVLWNYHLILHYLAMANTFAIQALGIYKSGMVLLIRCKFSTGLIASRWEHNIEHWWKWGNCVNQCHCKEWDNTRARDERETSARRARDERETSATWLERNSNVAWALLAVDIKVYLVTCRRYLL